MDNMVHVKLHIFASLRDIFCEDQIIELDLRDRWFNNDQLKRYLICLLYDRWLQRVEGLEDDDPKKQKQLNLPNTGTIMLAINETYIESGEEIYLSPNDHIALIPPVSGG